MMRKLSLILAVVLLPMVLQGCIGGLPFLLPPPGGSGASESGLEIVEGRYIVMFAEPYPNVTEIERLVSEAQGTLVSVLPKIGIAIVETDNPAFEGLMGGNPQVELVANDIVVRLPEEVVEPRTDEGLPQPEAPQPPLPARWDLQWDKRIIQADKAWEVTTGDPAVEIAILDTGIDYDALDLKGKIDFANSKSFAVVDHGYIDAGCPPEDRFGWGIIFDYPCVGEPYWIDLHFHGTWVAGIAAASGDYRVIGVCPDCTLIAVKVFTRFGWGYLSWIIEGIYYAVEIGVDVINTSIGPVYPYPDVRDPEVLREVTAPILRAITWAHINGVLVSDAIGNDAVNLDEVPWMHAGYTQYTTAGIGVAATGPRDELAVYSNYGQSIVDLAAPGGNEPWGLYDLVWGPCSRFFCDDLEGPHPEGPGGWIIGTGGTSAAAPQVAGTAGLVDSLYGGALNAGHLKATLLQTADEVGPRYIYGWGRVNACKAVGGVCD